MSSRIAVVGTGYVGLTSAAALAHLGHDVVGIDIDANKVEGLQRGELPILEHGLDELVAEGVDAGRLRFTTDGVAAVVDRQFIFLCVPTPQGADGAADLSYIQEAARTLGPHLASDSVVVNKSTVPVGSARVVAAELRRDDVSVVSNPEFLREGSAVADFLNPDRVVIGSDDRAAAMATAELYSSLNAPIMITDPASAETIKYASNAFLATKLSF
ncbi:MAG: UDP-glucose/GDP-mannose dehydrogenase family protein, partial [Candidatus Microthrix sp.]|nr:UDP-glucose/GDP-mannose dehydrogenase family protein [Candidatus Microthrix sp.]